MTIGKADIVILLSPDKETNVAVNLSNPQGKQFVFSGQYATINNEWCQPELITRIAPVYRNGDILEFCREPLSAPMNLRNAASTNTNSAWHTTTQKRNLVKIPAHLPISHVRSIA